MPTAIKARQKIGKYRIERKLADGGFGAVYRAFDTIEGCRVAVKIPAAQYVDDTMLELFREEVRLTARLDHPNILPIKNASFIDGHFVIVHPLGEESLADRLKRRISTEMVMNYAEQMLDALAYAHRRRIIHCDVKPDNFILFPDHNIKLADFGIARVAMKTISGIGHSRVCGPGTGHGPPHLPVRCIFTRLGDLPHVVTADSRVAVRVAPGRSGECAIESGQRLRQLFTAGLACGSAQAVSQLRANDERI